MKTSNEIKSSVQMAIMLATLASTVAYAFTEENIFRPPASRSRAGIGPGQTERKTETETRDSVERPASRRLQSRDLLMIAK